MVAIEDRLDTDRLRVALGAEQAREPVHLAAAYARTQSIRPAVLVLVQVDADGQVERMQS